MYVLLRQPPNGTQLSEVNSQETAGPLLAPRLHWLS